MPCVRFYEPAKMYSDLLLEMAEGITNPLERQRQEAHARSIVGTVHDHKMEAMDGIACGDGMVFVPCRCGNSAAFECDWELGGGRTCDAPICDRCRMNIGENMDLCRLHAKLYTAGMKRG